MEMGAPWEVGVDFPTFELSVDLEERPLQILCVMSLDLSF